MISWFIIAPTFFNWLAVSSWREAVSTLVWGEDWGDERKEIMWRQSWVTPGRQLGSLNATNNASNRGTRGFFNHHHVYLFRMPFSIMFWCLGLLISVFHQKWYDEELEYHTYRGSLPRRSNPRLESCHGPRTNIVATHWFAPTLFAARASNPDPEYWMTIGGMILVSGECESGYLLGTGHQFWGGFLQVIALGTYTTTRPRTAYMYLPYQWNLVGPFSLFLASS